MHHTLNAIQALAQHVHPGSIREAHKVVARAVKQVTTARRVEIEEYSGHDNDLLLQTSLEEVQTVGDRLGKALKVQPAELMLAMTANWLNRRTYR